MQLKGINEFLTLQQISPWEFAYAIPTSLSFRLTRSLLTTSQFPATDFSSFWEDAPRPNASYNLSNGSWVCPRVPVQWDVSDTALAEASSCKVAKPHQLAPLSSPSTLQRTWISSSCTHSFILSHTTHSPWAQVRIWTSTDHQSESFVCTLSSFTSIHLLPLTQSVGRFHTPLYIIMQDLIFGALHSVSLDLSWHYL